MSLGDYLRYLRALHGGMDTWTIARAIGLEHPYPINEIEQRYRAVGDDDLLAKLATYYDVPVEDLRWRRERSRKAFTIFADEAMRTGQTVRLHLRMGDTLEGRITWWDLGAVGLQRTGDGEIIVVQRHAVDEWESAAGN
ncbi:MAG: hypothetical protein J7M16_00755 [Anaerolineae bacterium]|nr:hypothetical protein [Anaerolineae bacterium]